MVAKLPFPPKPWPSFLNKQQREIRRCPGAREEECRLQALMSSPAFLLSTPRTVCEMNTATAHRGFKATEQMDFVRPHFFSPCDLNIDTWIFLKLQKCNFRCLTGRLLHSCLTNPSCPHAFLPLSPLSCCLFLLRVLDLLRAPASRPLPAQEKERGQAALESPCVHMADFNSLHVHWATLLNVEHAKKWPDFWTFKFHCTSFKQISFLHTIFYADESDASFSKVQKSTISTWTSEETCVSLIFIPNGK